MPGTAMLTPKDIAYRISLAEPIAVVTESAYASRFDEVREKAPSVRAYLAFGDARERLADGVRRVVVERAVDRHVDVQPSATGGLDERGEAKTIEHLLQPQRHLTLAHRPHNSLFGGVLAEQF